MQEKNIMGTFHIEMEYMLKTLAGLYKNQDKFGGYEKNIEHKRNSILELFKCFSESLNEIK